MPICDPHHHFWDRRLARIPYQRYLLDELEADIRSGHNVCSTVFIECRSMYRRDGPREMRPVGEVEFVQGLQKKEKTVASRTSQFVRTDKRAWAEELQISEDDSDLASDAHLQRISSNELTRRA